MGQMGRMIVEMSTNIVGNTDIIVSNYAKILDEKMQ